MTAIVYKWMAGTLVLVFCVAAIWFYGNRSGIAKRDLQCKAEIAAIESRAIEAERQAVALREKGRILADRLAAQAADAQAQLDAVRRSANDEIERRASAARRNLDSALVRLLNGLTPIRSSDQAGTATAGTAAPVPAARADPVGPAGGFASERAVVRAIADCRIGYESCRTRHSALAEWVEAITR